MALPLTALDQVLAHDYAGEEPVDLAVQLALHRRRIDWRVRADGCFLADVTQFAHWLHPPRSRSPSRTTASACTSPWRRRATGSCWGSSLEPELDRPVVVVVRVLAEQHVCALVAITLVGRRVWSKIRLDAVRDERLADVESGPEVRGWTFLAHRLGLEQAGPRLAGGDLVRLGQHLDVDRAGVALALLVDGSTGTTISCKVAPPWTNRDPRREAAADEST